MKRLFWGDLETINHAKKILKEGGVVLAEGDTVLGLLADVSEKGIAKLNALKTRFHKPYLILVNNSKKALNFIQKDDAKSLQIEKIMNNCWPGPVTLILKAKEGFCLPAQSVDGKVAIRVPDHAGLLNLLESFDALFSTSANITGQPVPSMIDEVDDHILDSISAIVMNDIHQEQLLPSTIIDCTGDTLVVIREGAFDVTELMSMMNN